MDKIYSKGPICQEEGELDYHFNQKNFCKLNFSIGGNESVPYFGADIKICTKCASDASEDAAIAKIKAILIPIIDVYKNM